MPSEGQVRASAPGRAMLFGEHAAASGFAAVAVAAEPRTVCSAQLAPRFMVNGEDLDPSRHGLVRAAVLHGWHDMDRPLAVTLDGGMPPGMGGDAAAVVACLGAMSMLDDHMIYEHVARSAFQALCEAGLCADPLDSSASTHGGMVAISARDGGEPLWSMRTEEITWHVRDIGAPPAGLVLGFLPAPGPGDSRARVARYCGRNSFARDIVRDIGAASEDGMDALEAGDIPGAGDAMNRSQRLLANLGASTPALDRLISAVSRHSHGAKLSGYSGDAIVALAREPEKARATIEAAGGRAFLLGLAVSGVRPED